MSYLTETQIDLNLPALTYSAEEQLIRVSRRTLLVNAGLAEVSPWHLARYNDPDQLAEAKVCVNIHAKLIGTPGFHGWLGRVAADSDLKEQVEQSTIEVIGSVFGVLQPELAVPVSDTPGAFGFNMDITEHNHANLHTLGSCACIHPHPEGRWVNYADWHEGYCEYDFHNIDADTQAWSLLAGMGHLAYLAARADQL